jgi:hypothetical protein
MTSAKGVEIIAQQKLTEKGFKVIRTAIWRPKLIGKGITLDLNNREIYPLLKESNNFEKAMLVIHLGCNRGFAGLPDYTCLDKDGDVFFVEVKSGRARLTRKQKLFMSTAKAHGFETFVMRENGEMVKE